MRLDVSSGRTFPTGISERKDIYDRIEFNISRDIIDLFISVLQI